MPATQLTVNDYQTHMAANHKYLDSLQASEHCFASSSTCMSKIRYFCLPMSPEHVNIRLRGIKLSDNTAYFVLYDFINILLGVEFETTNTRKIFLRLQNKFAALDESCKMFQLQFCGTKLHEYPCMTLKNLYSFKQHCFGAKTNEIDMIVEMFFNETLKYGFDVLLARFFTQAAVCTCNFESIVRTSLHVYIDQAAAEEQNNYKPNTKYVEINGLLCGGNYFFHLDECLLYFKAYAKYSAKGKSFCQRLRSQKYSISKEYDKYRTVAVQPLSNMLMFQSSSFYVSCEDLLSIIESAESEPNMQSRCNHKNLLAQAIEQVMSGKIHFI